MTNIDNLNEFCDEIIYFEEMMKNDKDMCECLMKYCPSMYTPVECLKNLLESFQDIVGFAKEYINYKE